MDYKDLNQTPFFETKEGHGNNTQCCIFDFMQLILLDPRTIKHVINNFHELSSRSQSAERDIRILIKSGNWRAQLIASFWVVLECDNSESVLNDLWLMAVKPSKAFPQILAALYLRDSCFDSKIPKLKDDILSDDNQTKTGRNFALNVIEKCIESCDKKSAPYVPQERSSDHLMGFVQGFSSWVNVIRPDT